jgi:cell division protein FtsZ
MGALTVAVVTRPFGFEGKRRMMQAERGMQELLDTVDTLIVIPNEKLLAVAKDAGFFESFQIADDVLRQGVQGISDIITIAGVINRDFADVKTTMAGMGYAVMGTATGSGENRAMDAAMAAMASPLLEAGAIDGARGILINITGSSNLKLSEVNQASTIIQNAAHEDCNIIFGAVHDERLGDQVKITVIATGFKQAMPERRARMMAESITPATDLPVPIRVRPQHNGASTARFASEEEQPPPAVQPVPPMTETAPAFTLQAAQPAELAEAPADHAEVDPAFDHGFEAAVKAFSPHDSEQAAAPESEGPQHELPPQVEPELVPVASSVFDDEFFRSSRPRVYAQPHEPVPVAQTQPLVTPTAVQEVWEAWGPAGGHGVSAAYEMAAAPEPPSARLFAGSTSSQIGTPETDELDIPAFLRRSR